MIAIITLKNGKKEKKEKFYNLKSLRTTENNELALKDNNYHEIIIDLNLVKKIEFK